MALSAKAIRIFSTVEVLREGQADVRHALAALFKPPLSEFDGEIYDPSKLARAINDQYKLGINRDILEEFVPIFEECQWLTRHTGEANHVAFVVTCPPDGTMDEQSGEFSQEAKELAQEFREFIRAAGRATRTADDGGSLSPSPYGQDAWLCGGHRFIEHLRAHSGHEKSRNR